ncbi:MAG: ABC transporter permease [Chloroflexi bacterium]|nr:ABC transporter permease [Chloroflexota bacterium]
MPVPRLLNRALFILVPVAVSLAITAVLIAALGNDPLEVFNMAWTGAFRDSARVAAVLNLWIPLTLCAIGLVITFTAGLWNIGVEGQMMAGAMAASWGAQFISLPQPVLIPVCVTLGALGGMGWAALVGLLKTRFGVNEIFGGVALNAIANTVAIYFISGPWQPPEGGSAQSTPPFPLDAWLPVASSEFPVSLFMLALVVGLTLLVIASLRGTRFGLELKATGKNAKSARLLGVPVTRTALLALILCGALAGMAGSHRVLHTYHALRPLVSGGIGFYALLIALLAGFRALPIPVLTFILAAILAGSTRVNTLLGVDPSLVGVLQGLIVLLILVGAGVRQTYFARKGGAA